MIKACGLLLAAALLASSTPAVAAPPGGDTLFASGDFDAAYSAYRDAVNADAGDDAAHLGLARVEFYRNDLDDAARDAKAATGSSNSTVVQSANRLLSQIAARRAASATPVSVANGSTTIAFLAIDPLPLLKIRINGHDALAFLDTGAPDVAIDPEFAKQLGLSLKDAYTGTFAGGRTATVKKAVIRSVDLGGAHVGTLTADVIPTRGLPFWGNNHADAIIGTIFLSRFLATIDYPHAQLILKNRTAASPSAAASIPMWLVGDHFIFARGAVNALENQLFLVDSGLAGGGFDPADQTIADAKIDVDKAHPQTGMGGGGPVTFYPISIKRLCLGAQCQANVPGATTGGAMLAIFPFRVSGLISHEYLKHYAVTLDFSKMQLLLSP